jgi:hypothetical protein
MSRKTIDFMLFHICAVAGFYMGVEAYRGANRIANCLGVILAVIVASQHRPRWLGGSSATSDDETSK